jgi:hypothetical protein
MRPERAVVLDPKCDFIKTHYKPERGDVVLHPGDRRWPGWRLGEEVTCDLDAAAIAEALVPPNDRETQQFFPNSCRAILTALLKRRPTIPQLREWITDQAEILRVVCTVDGEPTLEQRQILKILDPAPGAAGQVGGVMGHLNNTVAKALNILPDDDECEGPPWSAADWADHGPGWIFLTSTPMTRAALIPLQALWLDLIILRLMNPMIPVAERTVTHLILDELDALRKLTNLQLALTEGRSYKLAVVMGVQSHRQLEARYGKEVAGTMIEQASTRILLRMGEAGAKWAASEVIGDEEVDVIKESRQDGLGRWSKTTFAQDRRIDHVVLASQISGLPNLHGYIKVRGALTDICVPYVPRPPKHYPFNPRPMKALPVAPPKPVYVPPPPPVVVELIEEPAKPPKHNGGPMTQRPKPVRQIAPTLYECPDDAPTETLTPSMRVE